MKKSFCLLILSITMPLWSMNPQEASGKLVTTSLQRARALLAEPQKSLAQTPCQTARDMIQNFVPQRDYLKAFVRELEHHTHDQFAFDKKIGDIAAQACANQQDIPLALHTVRDIATRLFITWNRLQQDIALPQLNVISENVLKLNAASDLLSKNISVQIATHAADSQLVKCLQQGQELADLTLYEANRISMMLNRIRQCATQQSTPKPTSSFPAVKAAPPQLSTRTSQSSATQSISSAGTVSSPQGSNTTDGVTPQPKAANPSPKQPKKTVTFATPIEQSNENEDEHIPTVLLRGISNRAPLVIFLMLMATGISQVGITAWNNVHHHQAIIAPHYGHSTHADILPHSAQAAAFKTPCPWRS